MTTRPSSFILRCAVASTALLSLSALAQTPAGPVPAKAAGTSAPAKTVAASAAAAGPELPRLGVADLVAKNTQARGSTDAWRKLTALQLTGRMEVGKGGMDTTAAKAAQSTTHTLGKEGNIATELPAQAAARPEAVLPFTMDFQRPNKSRVEIEFQGKTAVQVYDGTHGWKYRPFLNRSDVEDFSAEELKSEGARAEPEGVLVDSTAKGYRVALDGTDNVDGKPAYRLKVTKKDGKVIHVWLDAASFLDVQIDGVPKRMDSRLHDVKVVQRDFRNVNGMVMPFVLETRIDGISGGHRMLIEKAVVNPVLDAETFTKPKQSQG